MTTTMKRRGFLSAIGGGALGAVGFLYPGAAGARNIGSSPRDVIEEPIGVDPTYAGGKVAAKTADGIVVQTPETARAVRIPKGTVVWKEFEGPASLIQLGDWVDVKGEPQNDGSLVARSGWVFVNIGRRDGVIEEISGSGMRLRRSDNRGGHWQIAFSRALEVIDGGDGSPLPRGLADLATGQGVGAVGLLLPNGGFRATRIWTYDS